MDFTANEGGCPCYNVLSTFQGGVTRAGSLRQGKGQMIYDAKQVEQYIALYQQGNVDVLDQILEGTQALIEVIVSRYNSVYRDDMIQECRIKLIKALKYYNPQLASSHSYFTSIFINVCNDFSNTLRRQDQIEAELQLDFSMHGGLYQASDSFQHDYLLQRLLERNRQRFPSYDTNVVDEASRHIFYCIIDGTYGKSRGAITELTQLFPVLTRSQAITLYHSSLAFFRYCYRQEANAQVAECPLDEDTLLPDLREVLGERAFAMVSKVFSGMYIKIP